MVTDDRILSVILIGRTIISRTIVTDDDTCLNAELRSFSELISGTPYFGNEVIFVSKLVYFNFHCRFTLVIALSMHT